MCGTEGKGGREGEQQGRKNASKMQTDRKGERWAWRAKERKEKDRAAGNTEINKCAIWGTGWRESKGRAEGGGGGGAGREVVDKLMKEQ